MHDLVLHALILPTLLVLLVLLALLLAAAYQGHRRVRCSRDDTPVNLYVDNVLGRTRDGAIPPRWMYGPQGRRLCDH